jgi:hypothetical protein
MRPVSKCTDSSGIIFNFVNSPKQYVCEYSVNILGTNVANEN